VRNGMQGRALLRTATAITLHLLTAHRDGSPYLAKFHPCIIQRRNDAGGETSLKLRFDPAYATEVSRMIDMSRRRLREGGCGPLSQ
jgi:hypothetical protein